MDQHMVAGNQPKAADMHRNLSQKDLISTTNLIGSAASRRPGGPMSRESTRAPPFGLELETNGFQFYAIANLNKTINTTGLEVPDGPSHCH